MTIGGALSELNNLLKSDDIPIYYKSSIKAVMDTIALSNSENPNKWIPVSERLPENGKEVLTCSTDGFIEIQSLENLYDVYWENQKGELADFDEVIKWMPLPKSYEPQESEEV